MDCFREGRRGGGLLFAMYGKCSRRTKHMQTNKPSALSHSAACVAWKGNIGWRSCCGVFFEWLRLAGVAQVACGPVCPASWPRRCSAAKGRKRDDASLPDASLTAEAQFVSETRNTRCAGVAHETYFCSNE